MILDTSLLIDVMGNDEKALKKLNELRSKGITFSIPSPVIFELFSGIERSRFPSAEKQKVENLLVDQMVIPLDQRSAEIGGEIDGMLIRMGKRIDAVDAMVAGIARELNQPIITRDNHFSRINGIKTEKY